MVDKPEEMIFYNRDFMKRERGTVHGVQKTVLSREKRRAMRILSYCRTTDFLSPTSATPTPRPYPDYSKLPDFHYLPGTKTPTTGRKPDDYQPTTQIKQMFQEGTLKAGDKNAIKVFLKNILFQKR